MVKFFEKSNNKYVFYSFILASVSLFALPIGLIVFMGDSYLYAERAKNIALHSNFNLDGGSFIYPPLYSIILSFAYIFGNPEVSHKVILYINIFLYSLIFFPIRNILIQYCNIKDKYSNILSSILSLSPFMLTYVTMMLSEVLYFPVLLWLAFFLIQLYKTREVKYYALVGIFLGLALLVRTASNTLVITLVILTLIDLFFNFRQLRNYGILLFSFTLVFGSWKLYESLFVIYKLGVGSYISLEILKTNFGSKIEIDHHFYWLVNCFKYYFTSPLSAATIIPFCIIVIRPKLFFKDQFIFFSFISSIGAAFSIVILTQSSWGGIHLTWNKYLAPYVIFFVFIALKYRYLLTKKFLKILAIASIFLFLSNAPYDLGCHFPDSLILFMENLAEWKVIPFVKTFYTFHPPALIANLVFIFVIFLPLFAFVFLRDSLRRVIPVIFLSIIYFFAIFASFKYWRNGGDLQIKNYQEGIGKYLYQKYKGNKNILVYIDPVLEKYFFQFHRIRFYVPFKISISSISNIPLLHNKDIFYITDKRISNELALSSEGPEFFLYNLKEFMNNNAIQYSFSSGFGGGEDFEDQGRKVKVRWLEHRSSLQVESIEPGKEIELKMKLLSYPAPRRLEIRINGERFVESEMIRNVLPKDPFQNVSFKIKLLKGKNILELITDSEPAQLSDGRKVTFLLLDDPLVFKVK